jgi:N-acetylglucosaminyldiphosphoundecaprenol N-acetyl-beta-D-mannosaminyltransferase
MHNRMPFLGIDFDPLTAEEAARAMANRASLMGPFAYVATPNVDHLVRLEKHPHLRPLYSSAWLTLCDSRVIELFAEASYLTLPAAPGADVVEILFREHIRPDQTILVIGGTAEIATSLRKKFRLNDLRWFDAPPDLADSAEARAACVAFIRKNPAAYVFLAVGSPQQELIAREAAASGDCHGIAICCGAALEFLTGVCPRAPEWMRKRRLEWLYRFNQQPERLFRRYFIDGPRIFMMWHRWRSEPAMTFIPANDVAEVPVATGGQDGRAEAGGVVLGSGDRRRVSPAA